jgi:acetyl-CoA acetyltransferase
MTNDVFLFDAVRTPRGRGRPGGGLHEVKPIDLVGTLLQALERRSNLDTERVDDIILGVVNPIGEQGSVLPKSAALSCGWSQRVCGVQLNRFCASGLEAINTAVAKIAQAAVRIADIAAQSLYLDFDTASRIEARGFVELVLTREANQRISAFFETNNQQRPA